jgi:acetyl esterase/lipase
MLERIPGCARTVNVSRRMLLPMGTAAVAFVLLAGGVTMASEQEKPQPPQPPKDFFERRIVYSVQGMDRVQVLRDRVYARPGGQGGQELRMDVYVPEGLPAGTRRPAVVFIHGGPLPPGADPSMPKPKDWGGFRSYGELAAASGFVGVTFNHRLYSLHAFDDSAADVQALLDHVRANAAELHVDPDRIAVWALSGGGPLLTFAFRDSPPWLKAVVSYYALLDLPPDGLLPGAAERLSPVRFLKASERPAPPTFIARAGKDSPVINASVEAFVTAALAKNLTLELFTLPDGQHGFDLMDDHPRSREAIARTIEFLKARLGP